MTEAHLQPAFQWPSYTLPSEYWHLPSPSSTSFFQEPAHAGEAQPANSDSAAPICMTYAIVRMMLYSDTPVPVMALPQARFYLEAM